MIFVLAFSTLIKATKAHPREFVVTLLGFEPDLKLMKKKLM